MLTNMRNILFSLFLIPTLLFSQSDFRVSVKNNSTIKEIGERKVEFGVKETVEEIFIEKGWLLNDSQRTELDIDSNGYVTEILVSIEKIESPHRILNIIGTKWLKKDYVVTVSYTIGEALHKGTGKRSTYLFAAFLDIENNEIPLNRKAFSKALQESLLKASDF